jgi:LAS superfamily LD-carboxypeptidase LdcB
MVLAFIFIVMQNIASAEVVRDAAIPNNSLSDFIIQKADEIISENIQDAINQYSQNFDTESDYSFQKYVSDKNVLQNKQYEPSDLVSFNTENIVNKAARPYLRQAAATAFDEMTESFYSEF